VRREDARGSNGWSSAGNNAARGSVVEVVVVVDVVVVVVVPDVVSVVVVADVVEEASPPLRASAATGEA
jgi:hypothetical protein